MDQKRKSNSNATLLAQSSRQRIVLVLLLMLVCTFGALAQPEILRDCPMVVTPSAPALRGPSSPMAQVQSGNCRLQYDPSDTTIYRIPVVVHIIHNGEAIGIGANVADARVYEQIQTLNEDFRRKQGTRGFNTDPDGADPRIEFVLATVDTAGRPFDGIIRVNGGQPNYSVGSNSFKRRSFFRSDRYFNIWVINLNTYLGYGSWPVSSLPGMNGLGSPADSAFDGLVISYKYFGNSGTLGGNYNLGRTATHEIGHCLGLLHVWADGNCQATDYCNDTPSQDGQIYFCPTNPPNSCPLDRPGPDQIANYMQYTDDRCMNLFTADQVRRMRTVMQTSMLRCTLPSSPALGLDLPTRDKPLNGARLYPNPSNEGFVTIQLSKPALISSTKWYDSMGKALGSNSADLTEGFSGSETSIKIEAPRTPGIYFLRLTPANGQAAILKLVVR